ncbi:MAG: aminoacetone oxidase family FAD-binding enzyme [Candidatus Nealsonbacteria bacterium CG_4_10_14_0_2_um_filter_40_15]|uniref:Aminoacetone oxidase family FAD-binding enzyme n=2 Tax=Candidatus Nealsoniibacteriota TaxID=1817911 RepID=A0A2M7D7D7_9BACT|nr:MAG: aminoacetone oxidase family FAD-binding enzyme [Candidatus Nealsonbacteria bacterium CG02_land_8_20_14_3_00_40_11]PIZ87577.1 MAG: aminoacetone oxidase family FAD-binding enzyme [Candidatus Nealsonbacteria bacterium CG_4_10_14_0_2_um_filter_40_15]
MEQLSDKEKYFDVAVIGGGPSGMMASGKAGEAGAKVLLIEKNKTPGKKLLLTGKGRCNFTRAEFNERLFVEDFGKGGKFLLSALFNFGAEDVIGFFEKHKLKTKIERGKRVFPATDQAEDVLNVLIRYLEENKVQVMGGTRVVDLEREGNRIKRLVTSKGDILAKNFIICTGGKSYPLTGSAGDGYDFARKLGHKIITPEPALVPIKIKEKWAGDLQGLSLKNVQINVFQNGKKQDDRFGEMLFAHFGLSGPIILDISKKVGELLKLGETIISLDLKPALEYPLLDQRIQKDFKKYNNKIFKNSLKELLPQKLIPVIIKLSGINPEKTVNVITKEERKKLVDLLKNLKMQALGLLGFDQAIVTSGGVDLKEIDPKTMKSKLIDNLFFAGEIINLHGPTGGYNLQLCWSTGCLAGKNAARLAWF